MNIRTFLLFMLSCMLLSACVGIPIIDYLVTDRKAHFELWANGIVNTEFGGYYRNAVSGGLDKGYGIHVETHILDSNHDEHVFRQGEKCLVGLSVNKPTGKIDAWRYAGDPSDCWAYRGSSGA